MSETSLVQEFTKGLWKEIPPFRLVLGLCPTLAVTKAFETGIGMGIAVPHIRLASVTRPVMSTGFCRNPLTDYQSLDGIPIHLIFMIAAGQNQHAEYLRLLSSLSLKLKNEELRNSLISAPDTQTFYQILTHQEK